jgi:hypothetical protein
MVLGALHGVSSSITRRFFTTSGLEVYYNTFDTNSYTGGSTIYDLTSNNLNGLVSGSPPFTTNYLTFSNDYIRTPNLRGTVGEIHSVELWVYPTNNGVLTQYNGTATPNASYHHSGIEIVSGKLEFGLWNGSGITSTGATSSVTFSAWSHIVMTYNGATVKGYLNGNLVGNVNVSWDSPLDSVNTLYLTLGSADTTSQGDGSYFDGRFGIMRVYSRELTLSEINRNFNSSTGRPSS